jgi:hypothetical protein
VSPTGTQLSLFDDATGAPAVPARPAGRTSRPKLTPAAAADLYRSGQSACEIAADRGITRQGAENRIRAGGLAGVQWCRIHRAHEELRHEDPGAKETV